MSAPGAAAPAQSVNGMSTAPVASSNGGLLVLPVLDLPKTSVCLERVGSCALFECSSFSGLYRSGRMIATAGLKKEVC